MGGEAERRRRLCSITRSKGLTDISRNVRPVGELLGAVPASTPAHSARSAAAPVELSRRACSRRVKAATELRRVGLWREDG